MSVGSELSQYPSGHQLNSVAMTHVTNDLTHFLMLRLSHWGQEEIPGSPMKGYFYALQVDPRHHLNCSEANNNNNNKKNKTAIKTLGITWIEKSIRI